MGRGFSLGQAMIAAVRFVLFLQYFYILLLIICEVVWLANVPMEASVAYYSVAFGYVAGRVFEVIGS